MGSIRQFVPVKLFVGVLVSHARLIPDLEQRLVAAHGPIDHRSPVIPFDFTDYYEVLPSNKLATALWLESDRMRSLAITAENLA